MTSYYNEVDKHAAAWLRELVKAGHIADGIVDERDIQDVLPSDLDGFTQCHFFAGIGVWSYALRNSGWADDRPVWTGSCPCQPFSAAGKGSAFADERHLWPAFHHLIKECRPPVVFGEQVAGSAINPWVDLVHADLEAVGYAFGCVPFPSASVGAPHIRDRAYWVADAGSKRLEGRKLRGERIDAQRETAERSCEVIRLADANSSGLVTGSEGRPTARHGQAAKPDCCAVGMADASGERRQQIAGSAPCDEEADGREGRDEQQPHGDNVAASACEVHGHQRPGQTNGFWRDADWLRCRDGKWRPVEPGAFPLVARTPFGVVRGGSDGFPIDSDKTGEARVMRLRGYGNSINAVQAQAFIEAFMGYQQQVSA
jgi:DNA (cytosine-5)-methyltransferase 1